MAISSSSSSSSSSSNLYPHGFVARGATWGYTAANGFYTATGSFYNGARTWTNGSWYLWWNGVSAWEISHVVGTIPPGYAHAATTVYAIPGTFASVGAIGTITLTDAGTMSSSSSSSSSDYGHLDPPTSLKVSAVDPVNRTVSIKWDWVTFDHWSNRVTPTAFIVERQVNNGAFEIITYSVSPTPLPVPPYEYDYDDVMPEDIAIRVFAYGQQLAYRVKVYWIPV